MYLLVIGIMMCNSFKVTAIEKPKSYMNYYGISITEEEDKKLQNLGFTRNEIMFMSKKEFLANRELEGEIVSTCTKYFATINEQEKEISALEYEISPFSNTAGYIETGAKKMTTTIVSVNGRYRYKVNLEWKSMPSKRSYDIIGIGIENNVKIYTPLYFQQNYCYSSNDCESSIIATLNSTSTGGGASFQLPSRTLTSLSSYLYFDVIKNTTATITQQNAYGDYSHATKTISKANTRNYKLTRTGITLDDSISSYYDAISYAKAVWTGSW